MEIRPPTDPIDDPFFAAVRRRHPDVDIVVLPPETTDEASAQVSPEEVAAAQTRVVAEAARVWAVVEPAAEAPETRLGFGDSPSTVRAVARSSAVRGDGFDALVRLRVELEREGWELRRRAGVGVERLTGVHDGLRVSVSYAERSELLLLTLSSEAMEVGVERARELTGRGGED
jgi:hypothetical protein